MQRCHECRKRFTQKRSDQVFCKTACRMLWFGRKAKMAMRVFDLILSGDFSEAKKLVTGWKTDADARAAAD